MLNFFDTSKANFNLDHAVILNRVRLVAIVSHVLLIALAHWYLAIKLPLLWLVGLLWIEVIFQLYSWLQAKKNHQASSKQLFAQLVFDSCILAALVYFTGGSSNPFIYLLLLYIALGTLMLAPQELIFIGILQLILYSILNNYQQPLELTDASPLNSFHMHMAGMWVNFVLTVVLIAIFGLLARYAMLKQEKKIQQLHEKQLKDEQLLSLGIMSASAAHELGTPLATMAVVIDDLKYQVVESGESHLTEDLVLLSEQIQVCRGIIQSLSEKSRITQLKLSGKQVDDSPRNSLTTEHSTLFKLQINQLLENWLVYRPQIQLIQHWEAAFDKFYFSLPISVEQGIVNLLDNAADASVANGGDKIEIAFVLAESQLLIKILDFGQGITEETRRSIGVSLAETDKENGLGWGLFLSNASIERVGGQVKLSDIASGGTETQIALPLKATVVS